MRNSHEKHNTYNNYCSQNSVAPGILHNGVVFQSILLENSRMKSSERTCAEVIYSQCRLSENSRIKSAESFCLY